MFTRREVGNVFLSVFLTLSISSGKYQRSCMMKSVNWGRLFLSNSFILNCQIISVLAVALLLSDMADASHLSPQFCSYEYSIEVQSGKN